MIYIGVLIIVVPPAPPGESRVYEEQPHVYERDPNMIYRDCPACRWWGEYPTESKAKMGFASHLQWCKRGHGRKVLW